MKNTHLLLSTKQPLKNNPNLLKRRDIKRVRQDAKRLGHLFTRWGWDSYRQCYTEACHRCGYVLDVFDGVIVYTDLTECSGVLS